MQKLASSCLILGLTSIADPSIAQSWGWVQGNKETFALVDESSLRVSQGKTLAWAQYVYRTPIDGVSRALVRYEVDCSRDMVAVISFVPQSTTDEPLPQSDERLPSMSPAPGTLQYGVMEAVCRGEWIGDNRFSTAESAAMSIWAVIDRIFQ